MRSSYSLCRVENKRKHLQKLIEHARAQTRTLNGAHKILLASGVLATFLTLFQLLISSPSMKDVSPPCTLPSPASRVLPLLRTGLTGFEIYGLQYVLPNN